MTKQKTREKVYVICQKTRNKLIVIWSFSSFMYTNYWKIYKLLYGIGRAAGAEGDVFTTTFPVSFLWGGISHWTRSWPGCWPASSISRLYSPRHTRPCLPTPWRLRIWTEVFTSISTHWALLNPSYFVILFLLRVLFQINFKMMPGAFVDKYKHARLVSNPQPMGHRQPTFSPTQNFELI